MAEVKKLNSIRQDQLPKDARDLIAAAFHLGMPTGLGVPMNAVEVRLDSPIRNILEGGDGFMSHGLSQSLRYFTHRDDEGWAVIFDDDCDGDFRRGVELLEGPYCDPAG